MISAPTRIFNDRLEAMRWFLLPSEAGLAADQLHATVVVGGECLNPLRYAAGGVGIQRDRGGSDGDSETGSSVGAGASGAPPALDDHDLLAALGGGGFDSDDDCEPADDGDGPGGVSPGSDGGTGGGSREVASDPWVGADLFPKPSAKTMRLFGKAMGEFSMVREGDNILVGLSGGKDSLRYNCLGVCVRACA